MKDPFKTADMLIQMGYRVPLPRSTSITDDWEPHTMKNNTVDLGELLSVIRNQYFYLQDENVQLKKKLAELLEFLERIEADERNVTLFIQYLIRQTIEKFKA